MLLGLDMLSIWGIKCQTEHGVAVDPAKVKSAMEWKVPHNVKGVLQFLGLPGYNRKFIVGYGKITKPRTELTKKKGFQWGPEAMEAFKELIR